MKKLILFILLSILLVAYPRTAHASYAEGATVPQYVIAPLMAWVEAQTGIQVPRLPKVMASRSTLRNVIKHMRVSGRAQAVYVGGMVVVDHHRFEATDSTQLSLLVHELVHYAQSFTPKSRWSCAKAKEEQAYSLQNKWLEATGHHPIVRASWIKRMASCSAPAMTVAYR